MAYLGTGICLILSLAVIAFMAAENHESLNHCAWSVIVLISAVLLGYHMQSIAPSAADSWGRTMTEVMMLTIVVVLFIGIYRVGWLRWTTYSRKTIILYALLAAAMAAAWGAERVFKMKISPVPYVLLACDVLIAADCCLSGLQDIARLTAANQKESAMQGYVAFDESRRFLCCNARAIELVPDLASQDPQKPLRQTSAIHSIVNEAIDAFEKEGVISRKFKLGEMTCACEVSSFRILPGLRKRGYLLNLRDASEEQRAIDVMTAYNETLNAEVSSKTENIRGIQQKVVLGMANFIENRDNNTGGHVKRTSDIIHILVDEILRQGRIPISEQMAEDIVRAAPMHDLGKVSIDSSILCKPGRLTDEEFRIMRTHSTKSGEMVLILLDGVEEDHFVETAFHVARFHHERWDGRGYPEGLVGTMIPLEARIMAVADVYDALVSKRCYKEPMSFEQAQRIMCEGMGTQFDPNMKNVFLGCREALEEYYRSAD